MKCIIEQGMKNSDIEDIANLATRYRENLKSLLRNLKNTTEIRLNEQLE
jgi:hypothetical protein